MLAIERLTDTLTKSHLGAGTPHRMMRLVSRGAEPSRHFFPVRGRVFLLFVACFSRSRPLFLVLACERGERENYKLTHGVIEMWGKSPDGLERRT